MKIDCLYLGCSLAMTVLMVLSAARGEFAFTALQFIGALAWFNNYLMRNEVRLLMMDWKLEDAA